ncbi:ATP-binding protein [Pseudonocardia sp. Cha107L01]|uniref:ATP-binding protein n=1 Tax=Pseudonocardia sp. Cha107L01 TaxID=3457576 RepID=UPI00403E63CB
MAPPSDHNEHRSRPEPLRRDDTGPGPVFNLDVSLAAHWIASSLARDRTQLWLEGHHWPPAQIEDLVLAISEAVSNSVEHGYLVPPESFDHPGVVRLHGHVTTDDDGRRVVFTITDDGCWKAPGNDADRGMGLHLMRACADTVDVSGTADGTRIELVSRHAPPAPPG